MSQDNFIPTGELTIRTGLDEEGDRAWQFQRDEGLSDLETIGALVTVTARMIAKVIGRMRPEDDD